jgi:hypothetical protein
MTSTRHSTRGWRRAAVAAFSLLTSSAMASSDWAAKTTKDEFLDFNDNEIPHGWSLDVSSGGDRCGVAKRRFFAGQYENACSLESSLTILPSTQKLKVKWKGNLSQSSPGSHQGAYLSTSSTSYSVGVEPSGNGRTGIWVILERTGIVFSHSDLPDGTYHYTLQLSDKELTFSGSLNGTQMFSHVREVNELSLDRIQKIRLSNAVTSGSDRWMDNVSIRQVD